MLRWVAQADGGFRSAGEALASLETKSLRCRLIYLMERSSLPRGRAIALVLPGLVLLVMTACGASAEHVTSAGACENKYTPPSPQPSAPSETPALSAEGARVRALWQGAPWGELFIAGDIVVGLDDGHTQTVRALSVSAGAPVWATTVQAKEPFVLALIAGSRVLVVESGHCIPSPSAPSVVAEAAVLDLATGKQLWSTAVPGNFQGPAIVEVGGALIMGGPDGTLTARDARTGRVLWSQPRPGACRSLAGLSLESPIALSADGTQLVASFECQPRQMVERIAANTGQVAWQWSGPITSQGNGASLRVVGTAQLGSVVIVAGGIFPSATSYAATLPHPYRSPSELGPELDGELVLALDADTGRPRWSEVGGQFERFYVADGAVCESVQAGVECRDDVSGAATRPFLLSGYGAGSAPPYFGDGYAGISGRFIALTLRPTDPAHVVVVVTSVRSATVVSRIDIRGVGRSYDFSNYQYFVIAGGTRPDHSILVLVRRIDLPGFPVDALSVASPTS